MDLSVRKEIFQNNAFREVVNRTDRRFPHAAVIKSAGNGTSDTRMKCSMT